MTPNDDAAAPPASCSIQHPRMLHPSSIVQHPASVDAAAYIDSIILNDGAAPLRIETQLAGLTTTLLRAGARFSVVQADRNTVNDDTLQATLTGANSVAGTMAGTLASRCSLGRILDTVRPDNRTAILDLLHGDTLSDKALAKMLTSAGGKMSASTLSDHRRQVCVCTTYDSQDAA